MSRVSCTSIARTASSPWRPTSEPAGLIAMRASTPSADRGLEAAPLSAAASYGGAEQIDRLPVTLPQLAERKRLGEPIVMVTAYDFPSAQVAETAGVDIVLVGDTGAMTVLGYPSTVPVSVEEMLVLARAARRGLYTPLLVADLPFGLRGLGRARRRERPALCQGGWLRRRQDRGGGKIVERARAIIEAGVPVMGHVGLTPQTATALGGYRAQGRTAARAFQVAATRSPCRKPAASRSSSRRSPRPSRPRSCPT